ncbi:hypothetical protein [Bradyrhizobium sp. USDA 4452]
MITFNGKRVTNPIGYVACVCAIIGGIIIVALFMLVLPFLLVIALVLHPFLVLAGRKGCIRDNGTQIIFDKTSFEKQ